MASNKAKHVSKDFAYKLRAMAEMKKARYEFVKKIGKVMKDYDLFMPIDDNEHLAKSMLKNKCRNVIFAATQVVDNLTGKSMLTKYRDRDFAHFDIATRTEMVKRRDEENCYSY